MPFITPPSQYQILGSNITGGSPNLIVNNGVNNLALGNFVLTANSDGDSNLGLGNNTLNLNTTGDENIAIGVNALSVNVTGSQNVVIGANSNRVGEIGAQNIVIGSNSINTNVLVDDVNLNFNQNTIIGSNIYDALPVDANTIDLNTIVGNGINAEFVNNINSQLNIILGTNLVLPDELSNTICIANQGDESSFVLNNNIVIGNPQRQFAPVNNILIAPRLNDNEIATLNDSIIIGDPNRSWTQVLVGGIDILSGGGGGGFAANAVQNNNENVSITSVANDGVSNVAGTYVFNAQSDNATSASSTINVGSQNNNINSLFAVELSADIEASSTFTNEVTDGLSVVSVVEQINAVQANKILKTSLYVNAGVEFSELLNISDTSVEHNLTCDLSTVSDSLTPVLASHVVNSTNIDNTQTAKNSVNTVFRAIDADLSNVSGEFNFSANSDNVSDASANFDCYVQDGVAGTAEILGNCTVVSGVGTASLQFFGNQVVIDIQNDANFTLGAPSETGTDVADFTSATAPVTGLTITNWLKVSLNGVDGYIPFLSA